MFLTCILQQAPSLLEYIGLERIVEGLLIPVIGIRNNQCIRLVLAHHNRAIIAPVSLDTGMNLFRWGGGIGEYGGSRVSDH
jgi:hypothetical protein